MKDLKFSAKNIVLISLVVTVWGYFGWKLFEYYSDDEVSSNVHLSYNDDIDLKEIKPRMNYDLRVVERDPFLNEHGRNQYIKRRSSNKSKSTNQVTTTKNNKNNKNNSAIKTDITMSEEINWPEITFKGIVENPKTKQKAALIIYNKHESFYLVGDKIANCELIDFNEAKVILSNSSGNKEYNK